MYTIVYLNNILIYSIILEDHRRHVQKILGKLLNKQLCCKLEKYEFHQKEVVFLGFLIDREDIKINLLKIERVLDWPQSKNLKEL